MSTIRSLPALVRNKFKLAQETGDLTFYSTQVSILSCNGLPVRVTLRNHLSESTVLITLVPTPILSCPCKQTQIEQAKQFEACGSV